MISDGLCMRWGDEHMKRREHARNDRKLIGRVVRRLRDLYRPTRMILFGSYAHGHPTTESDLDLLIIKKTKKPFYHRLVDVRRVASPVLGGHPFDPIVVTPQELRDRLAHGDQFLHEVVTKGQQVYGGE